MGPSFLAEVIVVTQHLGGHPRGRRNSGGSLFAARRVSLSDRLYDDCNDCRCSHLRPEKQTRIKNQDAAVSFQRVSTIFHIAAFGSACVIYFGPSYTTSSS